MAKKRSPLDQPTLLELYRTMFRIRRFEEEAARAYAQGKIGGFLHLYIGQESIAAGATHVLRPDDFVFQTYRDHGTALARGMTPGAALAELFGKDTGCSRGLGGSMHFFDAERSFLGGYGVVGGHVAVAAGAAFRSRYLDEDRITMCFLGEGATHIGAFHEGLTLAGLWKLPVVFVVENNQYAMGSAFERVSPVMDLTTKAAGYGIKGLRFDGTDVQEVVAHLGDAVKRARDGAGATLVETLTYRFRGHSMSDPGKYRTREELEERKKRDPVALTRQQLLDDGTKEADLDGVEAEVEEEIQAAIRFAEESEPAREHVMFDAVLAPVRTES